MDKENRIVIGELFKEVLEKQKESVRSVTYNICEITDKDACEMIAKKILAKQKVL